MEDEQELVAAEADHRTVVPARSGPPVGHDRVEALGDLDEDRVADGVTPRVVDQLEAIHVDRREEVPRVRRVLHPADRVELELVPVAGARERIDAHPGHGVGHRSDPSMDGEHDECQADQAEQDGEP